MSNNEKQDEKELWQRIPNTQGTERAETFVALSHLAYDRGDHKASLALCESAREIYEQLGAETSTSALLHVYEGISWSLRKLDRDEEAAELALRAVDLLKEDSPTDAADISHLACDTEVAVHVLFSLFHISTTFDAPLVLPPPNKAYFPTDVDDT